MKWEYFQYFVLFALHCACIYLQSIATLFLLNKKQVFEKVLQTLITTGIRKKKYFASKHQITFYFNNIEYLIFETFLWKRHSCL